MILLCLLLLAAPCFGETPSDPIDLLNQSISNGEYAQALTGGAALAGRAKAVGDMKTLARAYLVISDAHYYLGHADLYRQYVEKALQIYLQTGDAAGIGRSYYNLAYCYERTDPARMLQLLQQSLPYSKQAGDLHLRMNIENAIGTTLWHLSRFTESISNLEESGRIADQLKEAAYKGTVLQNLGLDYEYLADYDRALKYYREALAIGEAAQKIPLQATSLGNMGNVLAILGDTEQALVCYRKSRDLHRKTGYKRGEMIQIVNLASIHGQLGEQQLYRSNLQEALNIAEEIEDLRGQVEILTSMAREMNRTAENKEAEDLLHQALAGAKKNGDPGLLLEIEYEQAVLKESMGQLGVALAQAELAGKHAVTEGDFFRNSMSLALQAKIHASRGENAAAAVLYKSAAEMHESIRYMEDLPGWYSELARLEPPNAELYYRKSLDAIRKLESLLNIDRFRIRLSADVSSIYHAYAGWLASRGRIAEAWRLLETGRNQGLKLRLAQAQASTMTAPERELLGRMNSLQRQLREEALDHAQRDSLLKQIGEVEAEYEDAQTEAATNRRTQWNAGTPAPSFSDRLVIQYAFSGGGLMVFSSDHGKLHFRKVADAASIQDEVRSLHQVMSSHSNTSPDALLSKLGEVLVGPELQSALDAKILVIPDGILYLVPFPALRVHGRYLAEDRAISVAPSLLVAAGIHPGGAPGAAERSARVLVIAQDTFKEMRSSPFPLPDLPGVQREARDLARYGTGSEALLNPSETRVKGLEFNRYQLVHFATHALIDENRPERSSVVLTADRENDGFLQAREIYRMALPVQAVILSACSSGGGKIVAGEGVLGLSHALFSAGARSLVLSLWNVSDAGSAEFMAAFYDELSTRTLAEALRRAQLRMIASRKWNHPFFWSAFMVEGDGDVRLNLHKPFPFSLLLLGACAGVLVLLAAYRIFRH